MQAARADHDEVFLAVSADECGDRRSGVPGVDAAGPARPRARPSLARRGPQPSPPRGSRARPQSRVRRARGPSRRGRPRCVAAATHPLGAGERGAPSTRRRAEVRSRCRRARCRETGCCIARRERAGSRCIVARLPQDVKRCSHDDSRGGAGTITQNGRGCVAGVAASSLSTSTQCGAWKPVRAAGLVSSAVTASTSEPSAGASASA